MNRPLTTDAAMSKSPPQMDALGGNDELLRDGDRLGRTVGMIGLSVGNYFLFFGTSLLLANNLSISDFDDYNVAISIGLVLSSFVTLGLEKLALQRLPVYREQRDWARTRGFLDFSLRAVAILGALAAVILSGLLEAALALRGSDYHLGIVIVAAFLPVIAVFLFLLEVATAYGAQLRAVAIYRLLLPVLVILGNLLWIWLPAPLTAVSSAVIYGLSWSVAAFFLWLVVRAVTPSEVASAASDRQPREWVIRSSPLLAYSLLMTIHHQSGVIILEMLFAGAPIVSIYAVALQTASFVVLLATSTNRFYLPQLSVLLVRRDTASLGKRSVRRLAVLGPLTAIYLAVIFLFGRQILANFGDEYVEGYAALCILAVSTSFSTLLSLSPFVLQYLDRSKVTLSWTAVSAASSIALCFPLANSWGATGAALAYAIPLVIKFVALRCHAAYYLRKLPHTLESLNIDR